MAGSTTPLFRKRPPSRGYGYDANGVAGWLFTLGFVVAILATAISAAILAKGPSWLLSVPLALLAAAEAVAFVWFAKRESERGER